VGQTLNGVKIDKHGMTIIKFKFVSYRKQLFILTKDVTQVFYVNDSANKDRHIVLQGKRKIGGVEDIADEEDYNQFDDLPPFGEDITIPTIDDTEEPTYVGRDHGEATIVK
jgi:hypothetical protein